ncbi:MAG: topoisomerase C-terminal repeat-containing protein, partial [Acidobacteriota bacterium]
DEFRSLEESDDVHTVTLERAVELLAAPKKSRRRTLVKSVLRTLGPSPDGQSEIRLMDGRYGPYVTDGTTNASLPKRADTNAFALDEAVALIKAKAAAGPSLRAKRRPAARKSRRQS